MPQHFVFFQRQRGVTLIELMIGITLGLMVMAVATVTLLGSRTLSGTVSDAAGLQQQASYAFSVIGRQIRQAGSLELNLNPDLSFGASSSTFSAMVPVAFDAPDPTGARPPFDRKASTLSATMTPTPTFTVGYQNYTESVVSGAATAIKSQLHDCLGQNPGESNLSAAPVLTSQFRLNAASNELVCTGTGASGTQAVIENITDFKVRYAVQPAGTANMTYVTDPSTIATRDAIYAIEICLELTGTEHVQIPATETYKNCDNTDTAYGNRLKMVFRSSYQLRSQGLTG